MSMERAWPKMMYRGNERPHPAANQHDCRRLQAEGWSLDNPAAEYVPQPFPRWVETGEMDQHGEPVKVLVKSQEEMDALPGIQALAETRNDPPPAPPPETVVVPDSEAEKPAT